MMRLLAALGAIETRADLRDQLDRTIAELGAARREQTRLAELLDEAHEDLAAARDEDAIGSLAWSEKAWRERCLEAEADRDKARAANAANSGQLVHAGNRITGLTAQLQAASQPDRAPAPALPAPIQALIDAYLREPLTAVLPLPSRDSVRAARDAWVSAREDGA